MFRLYCLLVIANIVEFYWVCIFNICKFNYTCLIKNIIKVKSDYYNEDCLFSFYLSSLGFKASWL